MTYLLVKILLIVLLAAFFGFLLGQWWIRRQFKDVSEEYSRLISSSGSAAVPNVDAMASTIQGLRSTVDGLAKSMKASSKTDLSAQLKSMGADLAAFDKRLSKVGANVKVDTSPFEGKLSALASGLKSVEQSVKGLKMPKAEPPDLSKLEAKIARLEKGMNLEPLSSRLSTVESLVQGISVPETDLTPLVKRIGGVETAVKSIQIPEAQTVDLQPMTDRISRIEEAIDAIEIPESEGVDLQPVFDRIESVEASVKAIKIPEVGRCRPSAAVCRGSSLSRPR